MQIESQLIPTKLIWPNTGQIAGLPQNPRLIKDERFDKLVQSIIDDPEMLHLRECLVVPYADEYVVIAGNMRLRATIHVASLNDADFQELIERKQSDDNFNEWFKAISDLRETKSVPCKILPKDTPLEKLKAYTIKDNVGFGEHDWDLLANEWDEKELTDWGLELPKWDEAPEEGEERQKKSVVRLTLEFEELYDYDEVKEKVKNIVDEYSTVTLKD